MATCPAISTSKLLRLSSMRSFAAWASRLATARVPESARRSAASAWEHGRERARRECKLTLQLDFEWNGAPAAFHVPGSARDHTLYLADSLSRRFPTLSVPEWNQFA